jgi:membrane associated rhomboid family serine protease
MDAVKGFKTLAGLALLMVAVQVFNSALGYSLNIFGLIPRTLQGLPGIALSPFLHGSFGHLAANLVPFLLLGALVMTEGLKRFVSVSLTIILLGGALVWLFGFRGIHVGASGWVFGLWAYILARAWFLRSWGSLLAASVVMFLYSGLIFGFIPRAGVSFEGHIAGAFAGFVAAKSLFSRSRAMSKAPR